MGREGSSMGPFGKIQFNSIDDLDRANKHKHLLVWHESGHPNDKPLTLSSDAYKISDEKLAALTTFMQETTWEHDQVSIWLKHLDYKEWAHMNTRYREIRD